jgi:fatty-acyl-CoA synthase
MAFPGLGSWIERRAATSPSDIALIVDGSSLTYRRLADDVRRVVGILRRRGVGPGERVAFHGRNDPAALTSLFGTSAIGAVWVPIHPGRPEDEVLAVLDDSDASLLIRADPRSHPDPGIPELEAAELGEGSAEPPHWWEPDPGDLAILAYTSGTTGRPKGVMLSHANVLWNVIQMMGACAFGPADVTLAAAPFTRMGGLGVTVLPTLFAGGAVVVPPAADGAAVLATIEEARVTVVFANPDLLEGMVRAPGWSDADLSSVRTGVVGGGLVPEELLRTYLDRGVRLRHGYGLTEAAPVVSLLDEREAATRLDSVGKPLPFVDVRAVRPDGSACEPGETGAWWIRGPNVSSGYWRRPPVVDADGWFPTGDVGSIDADGYLTFLDRASSAMAVGDEVVYPATIERALYGAAGVVDMAAVDVDGSIVAAIVAEVDAPPDPAALLARLRGTLAPHEAPSRIVRVDSIPRNAAGKVRRDELRKLIRRSLGGRAAPAGDRSG